MRRYRMLLHTHVCFTTHRHTDTQTHRHTDTQTHRHTDTHTHTHTLSLSPLPFASLPFPPALPRPHSHPLFLPMRCNVPKMEWNGRGRNRGVRPALETAPLKGVAKEADDTNIRRLEPPGLCSHERCDLLPALPRTVARLFLLFHDALCLPLACYLHMSRPAEVELRLA